MLDGSIREFAFLPCLRCGKLTRGPSSGTGDERPESDVGGLSNRCSRYEESEPALPNPIMEIVLCPGLA